MGDVRILSGGFCWQCQPLAIRHFGRNLTEGFGTRRLAPNFLHTRVENPHAKMGDLFEVYISKDGTHIVWGSIAKPSPVE